MEKISHQNENPHTTDNVNVKKIQNWNISLYSFLENVYSAFLILVK